MYIGDVQKVMKISNFVNGIRHNQLCEKLGEDFPASFDALIDRVRAFIRWKDMSDKARGWAKPSQARGAGGPMCNIRPLIPTNIVRFAHEELTALLMVA
jgi:hypothetical protein